MKKIKLNFNCVLKNTKIDSILKIIDLNGLNGVFVVDKSFRLIGIITDSDIRKFLLSHKKYSNALASELMKTKFSFLKQSDKKDRLKQILFTNKILLPIVNKQNQLVDYIHVNEFFNKQKGNKNIDKKILVIGGFGYIGSVLVEILLKNKFKVNVLDKNFYGNFISKKYINHKNLSIFIGDCFDRKVLLKALNGVRHVIHLGEIVGDPAVNIFKKFSIKNNFINTNLLLNECIKNRVEKFIFASSCSVYGASEKLCKENSKTNPVSLYAECKLACEKQIFSFSKIKNFKPIILRISTVHGLSNRLRFDLVANRFSLFALKNKIIKLFGAENWRPFIHVKDVANIFYNFLVSKNTKLHNQIYNLGFNDENYRILDIVEILKKKLKFKVTIDKKFVDKRNYFVSFKKLHNKIKIKKKYTLKKSIFEMIKYFKNKKINITKDIYHNETIIKKLAKK